MNELYSHLRFVIDLVLFTLGALSNLIGLIVFLQSPKLSHIGTRLIYIFLLMIDCLFLLIMIIDRSAFHLEFNLITYSKLVCKFYPYLNRILSTLSPMLLVYISLERYVSMHDLTKRFVLRKNESQLFYLFIIVLFNLAYYSPCLVYLDLEHEKENLTSSNSTTQSFRCIINSNSFRRILPAMDLFNRVIVPCILMVVSSVLLITSIRNSKKRVFREYGSYENRKLILKSNRDIKLAISLIGMNLLYLVLTLPLPICLLIGGDFSEYILNLAFYLFFLSYSFNLYIVYISNSLFRNEFLIIFKLKERAPNEEMLCTTRCN